MKFRFISAHRRHSKWAVCASYSTSPAPDTMHGSSVRKVTEAERTGLWNPRFVCCMLQATASTGHRKFIRISSMTAFGAGKTVSPNHA
jgi:hypothetical protein